MAPKDRSRRTASTIHNISGPEVSVRAAAQPRAYQENPNDGLGALRAYFQGTDALAKGVSSALGQASDMAKRHELEQAQRNKQTRVEKAKYAAEMGRDLPEELVHDTDALHAFHETSGALAGDDLYRQYHDEVVRNYRPGSGQSLRDQTEGWIRQNLGDNNKETPYNLSAYGAFWSRAQSDINSAQSKNDAAVVNTQRAGLGETIRNQVAADDGLSREWFDAAASKASALFPGQTPGQQKAWVLNQAMGPALNGGQASRRKYLGLINSMAPADRPPEVNKIIQRFQTAINNGFSAEGDDAYGRLQDAIGTAQSPDDLQALYLRAQNTYRRYADNNSYRKSVALLNQSAAQMGASLYDYRSLMAVALGQSAFYPGSTKHLPQRISQVLAATVPRFESGDDVQAMGVKAQQLTKAASDWHNSSIGVPDQLSSVVSSMVTNSANSKARQGAVLALNGMDPAVADSVLKGHPRARMVYDTLKDEAITDTGEFSQRSQLILDHMQAFDDAHSMKLKDWLGDSDLKTEKAAEDSILTGKGAEWFSDNDESVGRQIARAAHSEGNFAGATPALSPKVRQAFFGELRYQSGLSKVKGDGAGHETLIHRAAQALGQRTYATPAGQGTGGITGTTARVLGQAAMGITELADPAAQGDRMLGRESQAAKADRWLNNATRENHYQLRLKTSPRMGEVDGRPGYSAQNFQGADTSSAALMQDDLNALSEGMGGNLQITEGDHAKANQMTVQNVETQRPLTFVVGQDNSVRGPNGVFTFDLSRAPRGADEIIPGNPAPAKAGTLEAAQAAFAYARDQAGLPSSVTIVPSKTPHYGGQTYEMVIGTRYPDDYAGAKPLRDAEQAAAGQAQVNDHLRATRSALQQSGRMPPTEGVTNYNREPEDYQPNDFLMHLGRQDLIHGRPGAGDDERMDEAGYKQRQFRFTAHSEGLRHSVYPDSTGHPTVGYGFNLDAPGNKDLFMQTLGGTEHDWQALRSGDLSLTTEESRKLFDARMAQDGAAVSKRMQGIPLNDEQRIALTDIAYNAGPDELDTELVNAFKEQDWPTAARRILFDTGTAHSAGLAARRWSQAMAAVGAPEFRTLLASGDLPSYHEYQQAQSGKDWQTFRNHWR